MQCHHWHQKISISGTSSIFLEVQAWAGIKYHALSETYWLKATINWVLVITLLPVSSSGALEVKVALTIDNPMMEKGGDFLGSLEVQWNSSINEEANRLGNVLKNILNNLNIQGKVNQMLSGFNAFYFPGANTFDFSDPVFNTSQDLIATVTIRGLSMSREMSNEILNK